MRQVSRRRFVWLLGGVGGSLGAGAFGLGRFAPHDKYSSEGELKEVGRKSWALGSDVSITVLHRDATVGKAAIEAAFNELELIEDVMSIYRPTSQLMQLNRDGKLDDPHPYLVEILKAAQRLSFQSDGAFDVTVQPLWEVYDQANRRNELPTSAELATARSRVGWNKLHVTPSQIRLDGQGSAITLNGIAQGFAADRVAAVLRKHEVSNALIDTGEINSLGAKANGEQWNVGIQHPRDVEAFVSIAALAGRCLATSGDYATKFSDDYRHHHLLDARTGHSPAELSSVSIVAGTALTADALSTAVFVMGPEAGLRLVERTAGVDALLILKDGSSMATAGFPVVQV